MTTLVRNNCLDDTYEHLRYVVALPSHGSVRAGLFCHLRDVLRGFGVDHRDVLAALRLDKALLDSPENHMSYRQAEQLVLMSEQWTGCDHIGLLVGQRATLLDMGWLGRLVACQSTAREGLQAFVNHFNVHNTAAIVTIARTNRFSRLTYAICTHGLRDTRHMQMGAVAFMFNMLRELCGPDWLPSRVGIAAYAPPDSRNLEHFLRAPVQFDQEESSITFEDRWLDTALAPVSDEEKRAVLSELEARRRAAKLNFPTLVQFIQRKQLLLGGTSMKDVARLLSMHRRTLDRRLKEHGVQFRDLLETVKRDVACQLLVDTEMPVQQVAGALRYASAANFATAFRRWSGLTPSAYRVGARERSMAQRSRAARAGRSGAL